MDRSPEMAAGDVRELGGTVSRQVGMQRARGDREQRAGEQAQGVEQRTRRHRAAI
jgi:hypothetical protein